jgi:LmbE family N-acetylglucosaminyl deacetylase
MIRLGFNGLMSIALGAGLVTALQPNPSWAQNANDSRPDSYRWNNRSPDPRYEADILLVVAHPDDEVMATAYLAREIYDHHKKVAVVYETAGDGGNNDVGAEQAAALGEVRKIEALRAVGSLGIANVWLLSGHDTPSQNVLNLLEHCGHGACLDELIRIVRITRPSVIPTWLPDFTTGENHADHQASGVLATEATCLEIRLFFQSRSPPPRTRIPNMTEALRPWQAQKIYYFCNPTHDIFAAQGPQYSSQEISPSRHLSYGVLAAQVFTYHLSQGGEKVLSQLADNTLASSPGIGKIVTGAVQLILGKSLVP